MQKESVNMAGGVRGARVRPMAPLTPPCSSWLLLPGRQSTGCDSADLHDQSAVILLIFTIDWRDPDDLQAACLVLAYTEEIKEII